MEIWKYDVTFRGLRGERVVMRYVDMPSGAVILCVQTQDDIPRLWAQVDTSEKSTEVRRISGYFTGEPVPTGKRDYLGTIQSDGLVVHYYEEID